jgi:hypothetical protein
VIESLDMTKEPFESLEELTAFESKVELAREWIIEAACEVGYQRFAVMAKRQYDVTLTLTGEQPRDLNMFFTRHMIEAIADNDEATQSKVLSRIRNTLAL